MILESLTDTDILLLVEEVIRVGLCHAICQYLKTNDKCIKVDDKK